MQIKDVPEAWAENLRQRAGRNHRSLQGELMAIIEQAVTQSPAIAVPFLTLPTPVQGRIAGHDRLGHPITRRGTKTIEQVYAEHLERFPEPFMQGPMSVDIIREDRDGR